MNHKECLICFDKLPKCHRVLPCSHKYHFKCIKMWEQKIDKNDKYKINKNTKYNCPYCRQEYSNMTLRKREIPEGYTYQEYCLKKEFTSLVKKYLEKIVNVYTKIQRINLNIDLFNILITKKYLNLIKNKKETYEHFVNVVLKKIIELRKDITRFYKDKEITIKKSNEIMTVFDKCEEKYSNIYS